jgi:hypothetical protein
MAEFILLRELEKFTQLQLKMSNRLKDGYTDLARAKHSGGRKFHVGTAFLPATDLVAHPSCRVVVNPSTCVITPLTVSLTKETPSTSTTTTSPASSTTTLRHRTKTIASGTSGTSGTADIEGKTTASSTPLHPRDPALLFGALSPPALKTCSSHFKSIVALAVELANCKQKIIALTPIVEIKQ